MSSFFRTSATTSSELTSARLLSEGVGVLLTTRMLPATFFLTVALARLGKLPELLPPLRSEDVLGRATALAQLAYHISAILFLLLVTVLFVVRLPPIRKSHGWRPRLMALLGSFLLTFIVISPQSEPTLFRAIGATILIVSGGALALAALVALGRSFSIFPEARRLVTRGPYAVVRHPMYLGEILAGLGVTLYALSGPALVLFLAFLAAQLRRMAYEEQILERIFPEYAAYKLRTARLIPRIY